MSDHPPPTRPSPTAKTDPPARGPSDSPVASSPPPDGGDASRRVFLDRAARISGVGLAIAAGYPAFRFVTPLPEERGSTGSMSLGQVASFPLDSSRIVRFGGQPVVVVRDKQGAFHALSAVCPHLQCVVSYQPAAGVLMCGCHQGSFALSGQNLSGPPPRPLRAFPIVVVADEVILGAAS